MNKQKIEVKNEVENESDRRKFYRVDSSVIIKVEEITGGSSEKGISKNISVGGILFEYNKTFSLGSVLGLEIRLPELGRRIECYGKIVRVNEVVFEQIYDIAVSFINMNEQDNRLLEEYIELKK